MFYCDVSCSFYTNNKEPKTKNKKQNKPDYSESKIEYLISDFQFARAAFFFIIVYALGSSVFML